MSDERLELVRRAIEAFNERDVDAMRELVAGEFEYDWSRSIGPMRGVYRGEEGFLGFVDDQWTAFDEVTAVPRDLIPVGDHVLAAITIHGRGRGGVTVSANSFQLFTFEESRLAKLTLFQDREEALAAARAE